MTHRDAEAHARRRPLPSELSSGAASALVRPVLAAALLLVVEVAWLTDRGLVAAPTRLLLLFALLTALAAVGGTLVALLWTLAARLGGRRGALLFTLLCAPPVALAGRSLFAGNSIRDVPFVLLLELAFDALALLVVRALVELHLRLARPAWRARAGWLATLGAAGALLSGWVDARVLVGHYPAFHLLLGAGTVIAATTSARATLLAATRARPLPLRAAGVGGALCLLALWASWAAWTSPAATALAAYSDGLVPKLRLVVTAARTDDGVPRGAAPAHDERPAPDAGTAPEPSRDAAGSDAPLAAALGRPEPATRAGPSLAPWVALGAASVGPSGEDGDVVRVELRAPRARARRAVEPSAEDGPTLWRARFSARAAGEPSDTGAFALALGDGRGFVAYESAFVASDAWTEVATPWVDVRRPEPPPPLTLEVAQARPDAGFAYTLALPDAWRAWASTLDEPAASAATLFEDDLPLGPRNALHRLVREQGAGAYSHWGTTLWFSASDGSDPRANGRRYRLALLPGDVPLACATLELRAPGAGDGVPRALLVRDLRFERHVVGPADDGDAASGARALLAGAEADAFRFAPTRDARAERVRAATRHVVVVLMDAFRDDHLGMPERGRSLTPNLDALATEGVRFLTAYAPSDHTGRSVPSLLTSYPLEVVLGAADHDLPLATWMTVLRDGGFRTFHNGSDYVFRKYEHVRLPAHYGAESAGTMDGKAAGLEDEVLAFATRADDERPFAVFTHWSDAHVGRSQAMEADYRAGVSAVDARLGRLVAGLRDADLLDETLLVVVSDHGYALGEDARWLAGQGCSEYALRVPFVLRVPGLAGPLRVTTPVSGLDLFGTLLDVLRPDAEASCWTSGVLALALDPDAPRAGPPVTASTEAERLLRDGRHKLVLDVRRDLRLLYDVEADPSEREPLFDDALAAALAARLGEQTAREADLLRSLVATHAASVPREVLERFVSDALDPSAVREVLAGFWTLPSDARTFVLRTIYQRDFAAVRFDLERLDRGLFEDDDQKVLALRAWAGSRPAAETLRARFDELSEEGLRWLVEIVPDLPRATFDLLAPRLLATFERLRAARPEGGSADERRLALLAYGLPFQLGERTPRAVRETLVELFDAWSPTDPGPYFSTLRTLKFSRRQLLAALRKDFPADCLDLLPRLVHNRDSASVVPEICLAVDGDAARRTLLDIVARWKVPGDETGGALSYMLPALRRFDDEDFRREANRAIQRNYPLVWVLQ